MPKVPRASHLVDKALDTYRNREPGWIVIHLALIVALAAVVVVGIALLR